jgi:hypothetical protein
MHNPTEALKSVTDPDTIFDINSKGQGTLQSIGIFRGIYSPTPTPKIIPNIKVDI